MSSTANCSPEPFVRVAWTPAFFRGRFGADCSRSFASTCPAPWPRWFQRFLYRTSCNCRGWSASTAVAASCGVIAASLVRMPNVCTQGTTHTVRLPLPPRTAPRPQLHGHSCSLLRTAPHYSAAPCRYPRQRPPAPPAASDPPCDLSCSSVASANRPCRPQAPLPTAIQCPKVFIRQSGRAGCTIGLMLPRPPPRLVTATRKDAQLT